MNESRRTSPRVATVIQVRYKRREDFVLEYARDISLGGMFIESDDPLPDEEPVELQFTLPGLGHPIKLAGKVVRVVKAKGEGISGMGIAFDDIDEFTRSTLMNYMQEMAADRETVIDRRGKSVRYDQVLEVRYDSVGEFLVDYSENISKNGLFIKTDDPQPEESILPMQITLPNGEKIDVTARVVHIVDVETAAAQKRSAGMGIEFMQYRGDSQERLWAYIESLS